MEDVVLYRKTYENLKNIFKNKFEIDIEGYDNKDLSKSLLGSKFNMAPRDLIHLFFEIEYKFNVKIDQQDIANGKFNSFNDILKIIFLKLQNQS